MIIKISDQLLDFGAIITLYYNKEKIILNSEETEISNLNNLKNAKIIIKDPIYEKRKKMFLTFLFKSFFGSISLVTRTPDFVFFYYYSIFRFKENIEINELLIFIETKRRKERIRFKYNNLDFVKLKRLNWGILFTYIWFFVSFLVSSLFFLAYYFIFEKRNIVK